MVERNDTAVTNQNANLSGIDFTCPLQSNQTTRYMDMNKDFNMKEVDLAKKFDWSEKSIGYVQSAYFVGYISTMVVGANVLIQGLGFFRGSLLLLILSTISTLAFPFITQLFGLYGAMGLRFIIGATHGPFTSLFAYSMYLWMLPLELTTTNALLNIGGAFGAAFSMLVCGQLLQFTNWITVHYVTGGMGIVITIIWCIFADDGPEQVDGIKWRPFRFSNRISNKERELIIKNRPSKRSGRKVPWRRLFLSLDVWIVSLSWFLASISFVTFNTVGVRFTVYVTQLSIKKSTELGGTAIIICMVLLMVIALLTDFCIKHGFSAPIVRKSIYTVFTVLCILSYLPVIFYKCNATIVIIFMFAAKLASCTVLAVSCKPIANELAGEYSGQVYAFANTFGNLAGVISKLTA